jgi:hypothetical protein
MDIQMVIGIASLITSIGTIAAVLVARQSFIADHERRKKQVTIEFYNNISNNYTIPFREELRKVFGEDYYHHTIQPEEDKWKNNPDLQIKFRYYCRNMERLAVGIAIGVFDFDTFNRLAGKTNAMLFNKIEQLIEAKRNSIGLRFCEEFERFYLELKLKHLPNNPEGKISSCP